MINAIMSMVIPVLAAVPLVPVGNFTVSGVARNYRGGLYSPETGAYVMAKKADGTVLAKASVHNLTNGVSYVLTIPLSNVDGRRTAKAGSSVTLVACDPYATYVTSSNLVLSAVNGSSRVNLEFFAPSSYAGIPQAYIDEITPYMDAYGYTNYNPSADWDGDGRTNKQEYEEGTNPFDRSDFFAPKSVSVVNASGVKMLSVTLETVEGRTYGVDAVPSLDGATAWAEDRFRVNSTTAGETTSYTEREDVGSVTFFMLPAGTSRFWQPKVR